MHTRNAHPVSLQLQSTLKTVKSSVHAAFLMKVTNPIYYSSNAELDSEPVASDSSEW